MYLTLYMPGPNYWTCMYSTLPPAVPPSLSPCPGGGGLIQDEDSGIVVAVEEVEVLHVYHLLRQLPQEDGVAGLDALVLTEGRGEGREGEREGRRDIYVLFRSPTIMIVLVHFTCT